MRLARQPDHIAMPKALRHAFGAAATLVKALVPGPVGSEAIACCVVRPRMRSVSAIAIPAIAEVSAIKRSALRIMFMARTVLLTIAASKTWDLVLFPVRLSRHPQGTIERIQPGFEVLRETRDRLPLEFAASV